MDVVPEQENEAAGLSREAVVAAAMGLLDEEGIDGLSMRALADRLGVRAASLYWHYRDKDQLLDALALSLLDRVSLRSPSAAWRPRAKAAMDALGAELGRHPSAAPLILGRPHVVVRSRLAQEMGRVISDAGVAAWAAAAMTLIVEVAIAVALSSSAPALPEVDQVMKLSVESGSTRVVVRAGTQNMVDVAATVGGASSVETRPDGTVLVRNWRGGRHGAVELNPAYAWDVKLHSGVWNVTLDLTGLRLKAVDLDSGSGSITCTLPAPQGVVPLTINSGIINVTLHRPPKAAAQAVVHTGSFRIRFDDHPVRALSTEALWESPGASKKSDRYDVTVHSGSMRVVMDATAPDRPVPPPPPATGVGRGGLNASAGVDIILDGIEQHARG